ncbi:hypothetical protein HYALB_00001285 [Hymenoscyphus albidus]|uniref:Acyl carrier protein n=1 Tax=Hymenoscyphus albidus TaxID=595503 RepID=A0A9N9LHT9_9HELO|nr:hypothetical protein HYALB_00001285 [Hymenoscyphus albidus]
MFRTALLRSARSATCQAVRKSSPIVRPASTGLFTKSQIAPSAFQAVRCYSAGGGLDEATVTGRIADLLKNFDKITPTSHFANDLGLDSLDTVEVVMAIEEEFSIEIPDKEADAIHSGIEQICEIWSHARELTF